MCVYKYSSTFFRAKWRPLFIKVGCVARQDVTSAGLVAKHALHL